ncbi:MAG: hypothetical protein JJE19_00590 [Methanosarcinales archaeon]|nr:hypothetical protein [Methanosarcinales archaeon]
MYETKEESGIATLQALVPSSRIDIGGQQMFISAKSDETEAMPKVN